MGRHFARVMEAYVACLHAHRPASIVFAEDIKPDTLKQYEAVLVVGQTVEMEPALAAALKAARQSGVAVFADGTCRAELVKDFVPLGLSFNHLEKDPSPAADDHAYWRMAGYAKAAAPQLAKALARVRPAAEVENPEVFVNRAAGRGRPLSVRGQQHHVGRSGAGASLADTLSCASLVPQVVPLKLESIEGRAVYDVFAGKQVQPAGGMLQADCRNMPARVFAILPAAVDRVEIEGPTSVARWRVDAVEWSRFRTRRQGDRRGRARTRPPAGGRRRPARPAICLGGVARCRRRVHPAAQRARGPVTLEAVELLERKGRDAERCRRGPKSRAVGSLEPGEGSPLRMGSASLSTPAHQGFADRCRLPGALSHPTVAARATSRPPTSRSARTSATWSSPRAASWRC